MSLNQPLNADYALLIVIDLQVGHMPSIRSMQSDQLIKGAVRLTQIAELMGIPTIFTVSKQAAPQGLLVPELKTLSAEIPMVERTKINAWDDPRFRALIEQSGRTQIILSGVALDVGVRLPALAALRSGLSAVIAVDAVGSTDSRIENAVLLDLVSSGASLSSVQAIGMELLGDITSDRTPAILNILGSAHSVNENPFENL